MELNEEIAEVIGALLGDGCISKYWSKSEGHWRYEVAFTGSADDFEYYKKFIQPVFKKYFNVRGRLFLRRDNSTRYHIRSRRVFMQLCDLGVPIGEKGPNLKIPDEIFVNNSLLLACVRGIWNTDGSIYRRYTKIYKGQKVLYGKYLVMELKMIAGPLVKQVKEALNLNGIKTSSITKKANQFVLRVGQQGAITKYLNLINFSNVHHSNRLRRFSVETMV